MDQILYYLLAGTRGGETRTRILKALKRKPQNANQLSVGLSLDYKTVTHHLSVLMKHQLISSPEPEAYGAVYFVDVLLKEKWDDFGELWG